MSNDLNEFGRRLRELRIWRGLNLRTAADLSGISYSYWGQIERGEKAVNNRRVLDAIITALRIAPTELSGSMIVPRDTIGSAAHASLREVEIALSSLDLGIDPGVKAKPWAQLSAAIEHLNTVLRVEADYEAQGKVVPELLTQLHAAYVQQPAHRREILIGLIHVYHSASVLTKGLAMRGFPVVAARLAEACARELDEPQWIGFAAWLRGHASGSYGRRQQYAMSVRAIDRIGQKLNDPNAIQAVGMLHLNAALAAASQADADVTRTHLDEAADLADRLPDTRENFGLLHFGPDNVQMWRVSLAAELGEGGKVIELAQHANPAAIPARARQGMYYADLGRALVTDRRTRDEGIATLVKAETIAPQRIRNNLFVRETVADLLRQAQRGAQGRELRGIAWRMGLAPTG